MPRFFTESGAPVGGNVVITGDDANHMVKALRMTEGEHVTVCDGKGTDMECTVVSTVKGGRGEYTVTARVDSCTPSASEPPYTVTVYQGLAKGDRFDTVIQKSVECGATSIVPVLTEFATVRLTAAECEKKRERWQKIAESAAKQCGRGRIPTVGPMLTLREAVDAAAGADLSLFFYECEKENSLRARLCEAAAPASVAMLIGPEGGFSPAEAEYASGKMLPCSLGPRILRTETAAAFALACLTMKFEM